MAAPMKRVVENNDSYENSDVKKSTIKSELNELNNFIAWSSKNDFQLTDKVVVTKEGSCAQFGMLATDDISKGEVLFQIPRKCLLTPDNCALADCYKKDKDLIQCSSGWVPLLLSLMYEYNNPSSFWRPYLDLVPDFKQLDLPMFWSSKERDTLLQGTGVNDAVNTDLQNIENEFTSIVLPYIEKHNDKFSPVCKDIEFYKKMVAFVMSYSFTENSSNDNTDEIDDGEEVKKAPPMMVPMADILNHVAKNNACLNFEKESLKMVAVEDIKKGDEVFNTYGELANLHLLHMYGFAEKYPNNHWDTVQVFITDIMNASKILKFNVDSLLEKKQTAVNELFGDNGSIIINDSGVLEEEELKIVLKICCAESNESLQDVLNDEWESDDEEEFDFDFKVQKCHYHGTKHH
ncbi:N-lysine methyltransferase setd6 [Mactra antiquata]